MVHVELKFEPVVGGEFQIGEINGTGQHFTRPQVNSRLSSNATATGQTSDLRHRQLCLAEPRIDLNL